MNESRVILTRYASANPDKRFYIIGIDGLYHGSVTKGRSGWSGFREDKRELRFSARSRREAVMAVAALGPTAGRHTVLDYIAYLDCEHAARVARGEAA